MENKISFSDEIYRFWLLTNNRTWYIIYPNMKYYMWCIVPIGFLFKNNLSLRDEENG